MPTHAPIRKPKLATDGRAFRFNTAPRAVNPNVHAAWRQRIAVTKILDRLQTFALDDPDNPSGPRLTRTQAMVALSLLNKVMPNVQSLEVSGNSDQPITVQILRFAEPADGNASVPSGTSEALQSTVAHLGEPLTLTIDHEPSAFEAQIEANPRLIEDEPPTVGGRKYGRSPRKPRKPSVSAGLDGDS